MNSDLKIEIWNFQTSKWEKIINTSNSSYKKKKIELVKNLYIMPNTPQTPHQITLYDPVFYKITIGYYNITDLQFLMPEEGLNLNSMKNLVLYNKKIDKAYHIAWVESNNYPPFGSGDNILKIVVQDDIDSTLLATESGSVLDPSNLGSDEAILSITTPDQIKSGVPDFEFKSRFSRASSFETLSISTNYSSIFNSNGKIYIRFSLDRDAEYRMGDHDIQYNGQALSNTALTQIERNYSNFPWGDGTTFDTTFDFKKINIREVIRRLNAHYISLNNVY